MRRRARRMFTLCSAASLVLAAAALVLWLLSYRMQRTYLFRPVVPPPAEAAPLPGQRGEWRYQWHASMGGGGFQVMRLHTGAGYTWRPGLAPVGPVDFAPGGPLAGATDLRMPGFRYFNCARRDRTAANITSITYGFRYVTVPGWTVGLVLGLAPTFWLLRHRRQTRRDRAGQCSRCGYDLRASPERCPECGTPAASS